MDGGHDTAIKGGVELTPLASRHTRAHGQAHGLNQLCDAHRVGWEHLTQERHCGQGLASALGRGHGSIHDLLSGVLEHGAREHVFGLGVGGHTKAGHINANDAHPVDLFGQQLQGHTAGGGHA